MLKDCSEPISYITWQLGIGEFVFTDEGVDIMNIVEVFVDDMIFRKSLDDVYERREFV